MNIAAIDIGSNAARLLIKRFEADETGAARVRKLLFIRIPLRLGKDVFTLGKVSKERQRMMLHMMKGFRQFMLLYEVEHFRACATSAMRDAENGRKLMLRLEKETGIALEIIPGAEEAQLLCNNLVEYTDSRVGNFAYVDFPSTRRSSGREPFLQYRHPPHARWRSERTRADGHATDAGGVCSGVSRHKDYRIGRQYQPPLSPSTPQRTAARVARGATARAL